MKKVLLLIFFFIVTIVNAQVSYPEIPQEPESEPLPEAQVATDTVQESAGEYVIRDYFKPYYIFNSAVGNNVLAKANEGTGGFGIATTFYSFNNISIIGGLEITTYKITDVSMTANGSRTNVTSPYFGGEYRVILNQRFTINPSICYIYSQMRQRSDEKKLGTYNGNGIRAAATADFAIIIPNLKVFAGTSFAYSWYGVNAVPEYKDYYRKIATVNVMAGIKIAF